LADALPPEELFEEAVAQRDQPPATAAKVSGPVQPEGNVLPAEASRQNPYASASGCRRAKAGLAKQVAGHRDLPSIITRVNLLTRRAASGPVLPVADISFNDLAYW
jgi:hypothetical protein